MKHVKRKRLFFGLLITLLIAIGVYLGRHWLTTNYYRYRVERTVTSELKPIASTLKALGFSDLTRLDTTCHYYTLDANFSYTATDQLDEIGTHLECSSGIDRFVKLPTDEAGKTALSRHVKELSKILQANGWKSRADYPTIPWFEKISQGIDYQPDQLNQKTVNGLHCMVDFFTAFSKPDPPAISLRVDCVKL